MNKFKFNKSEYLERINLSIDIEPGLESLEAMQTAQLMTIPFENFDICLSKGIDLEPSSLFNKLIKNRRGGY